MAQPVELDIKSSFLERKRRLLIDPGFIEFQDNDVEPEKSSRFEKENIEAFRYGVKWISGYQFTIGRIYCIDIRSRTGEIIKLRLKSLYTVNRQSLGVKYIQIVQALYNNYFDDITRSYLDKHDNGNFFEILQVMFSPNGVSFNKGVNIIIWGDLGVSAYMTYFALFSKLNPTVYKAFYYLDDWNAGVLYGVASQILVDKGLNPR